MTKILIVGEESSESLLAIIIIIAVTLIVIFNLHKPLSVTPVRSYYYLDFIVRPREVEPLSQYYQLRGGRVGIQTPSDSRAHVPHTSNISRSISILGWMQHSSQHSRAELW